MKKILRSLCAVLLSAVLLQVDDAGSLLDVPEQPLVGALLGAGQAFDGVSAPVEGPAEGGDALQAGEVQIILQTDRFVLAAP